MLKNQLKSKSELRIGIQGVQACFHDVAAREYFGPRIVAVECNSFKALCSTLQQGKADFVMMAIENSIAGSILTNYLLIVQYSFKIIGEVYLRIEHCLLALPNQTIEEIKFVQSHPMALLQCQEYLHRHPQLKVLEAEDTAGSARQIQENRLGQYAAIASELAGATYGLQVLEKGIETDQQNYTRFLAVSRSQDCFENPDANKSSLCFETPHFSGSLAQVLNVFSEFNINMTKIQSVPILGRPYQYSFHVDLEWEAYSQLEMALEKISSKVSNLIRLGDYPRGRRPG
jgi:prephenate dehydratase